MRPSPTAAPQPLRVVPQELSADDLLAISLSADPDEDGIVSAHDNCPGTANADQANSDGDDFGDACDAGETARPTVVITSPANGGEFAAGSTITVVAEASDDDGTVARVSFYGSREYLGASTSPPYRVAWEKVPPGRHRITAVATDNFEATGHSLPVDILVRGSDLSLEWHARGDLSKPTSPLD